MRFLGLVWATAVKAALAISGVAESSVAEAQDFESADTIVKGQTQPALNELGKALSDPKLARGTFLIAGHTDAKEMAQWRKASPRRLLTKKPRLSEPAGLPLPISTLPV